MSQQLTHLHHIHKQPRGRYFRTGPFL